MLMACAGGTPGSPLQAWTTSLWGAYSGCKLLSAATKPLVSRDTTAATDHDAIFTAGARGVLDSVDLLAFGGAHSQTVKSMTSQEGTGGHDFSAAGTGLYPAIVTAGSYLGKAVFDGSTDSLQSGNNSGTPTGFTVFLRGKLNTLTGDPIILEHSADYNSANACIAYYDSTGGKLSLGVHDTSGGKYSRSDFSGIYPNDNVHCYRFDRAAGGGATQAVLFVNGVKQTRSGNGDVVGVPSGSFDAAKWNLASRNATLGWAAMDLHTLLIFEAALSDGACSTISSIVASLA